MTQQPDCGTGDAGTWFATPGDYKLTVAPPLGAGGCTGGVAGVGFVVLKLTS